MTTLSSCDLCTVHVGPLGGLGRRDDLEARGPRLVGGRRLRAEADDHVDAAVAEVETLVEALGATTDHDHLLAAERLDAVGELVEVHEAALAEFGELCSKRKGVEVVGHDRSPREIERTNATDRRVFRKWTYVQHCVPISATMDE